MTGFCAEKNEHEMFEKAKPEEPESFCHDCFPGCVACTGPEMH
jgi:hypothetical protein